MSFERAAESKIREAMEDGLFDNLDGAGKPLPSFDLDALAGDEWLGHHILKNGGLLPQRLDLAKEVELELAALGLLDGRHAAVVRNAARTGEWERHAPAVQAARDAYEKRARAIRARQDRLNIQARSVAAERPGIWVEHLLAKLDERVRLARGVDPGPTPSVP